MVVQSQCHTRFGFPVVTTFQPSFFMCGREACNFGSVGVEGVVNLRAVGPFRTGRLLGLFCHTSNASFFSLGLFFVLTRRRLYVFHDRLRRLFFRSFLQGPCHRFPPTFNARPFFRRQGIFSYFLRRSFPQSGQHPEVVLFRRVCRGVPYTFF